MSEMFQCHICENVSSNKGNLKIHLQTHKDIILNESVKCIHCEKLFATKNRLKQHIKHVHQTVSSHKCTECGKAFKFGHLLKKHMESVHLKLKKYSCSLCPITFADPSALKRHIDRHKINANDRQFKCNECGHTFLLQQHLRNHMGQIHSGKVTCDICNKQLSKSGIMHHRKTAHSALSEVKCSQCELVFGDKGYLRKHLLTHTVDKEQKDFKCDQCDKAYHRQEYLSKHIRYKHNNSEEGKWQCKTCNKTFAQSGGLFMHKKSNAKNPLIVKAY